MSRSYTPLEQKETPNIRVLEANLHGKDYIIGDVHGSLSLLKLAVQELKPEDRLFIVGDLADRGEDSLGVYQFLIDHQKNNKLPQIIITRGNHEDDLLEVLDTINNEKDFANVSLRMLNHIFVNMDAYKKSNDRSIILSRAQALLQLRLNKITTNELHLIDNGGEWLCFPEVTFTDICNIKNFIKTSLPYVVTVKGSERVEPFHMVHADMPVRLTDNYLLALETTTSLEALTLSTKEKIYATWARANNRHGTSIEPSSEHRDVAVYCGHTPFGGARIESNHINLDVGSFDTSVMCLVNHHDFSVKTLSQKEPFFCSNTSAALVSIQEALKQRKLKREESQQAATIDRVILNKITNEFKNKKSSLTNKKERYLSLLQKLQLTPEVKEKLAIYLMDSHQSHLLAQEQGICRLSRRFSCQTKSFHRAMGYLLAENAALSRVWFEPNRHPSVFQGAQKTAFFKR